MYLFSRLGLSLWFLALSFSFSLGQTVSWLKTTSHKGNDSFNRVAQDDKGNIYAALWFSGPLEFEGKTYPNNDQQDVLLIKYDADGKVKWTKHFSSTSNDYIDYLEWKNGQLYVAALIGGLTTLDSQPIYALTVAQLDENGVLKSAKSFGLTAAISGGFGGINSLYINPDGSYYAIGYFKGLVDEPGLKFSSTGSDWDGFIAKIKANGEIEWSQKGVSATDTRLEWFAVQPTSDGVLICGEFKGTIELNAQKITSKGESDALCVWYKSDGSYVKHLTWGTTGDDSVFNALALGNESFILGGVSGGLQTLGNQSVKEGGLVTLLDKDQSFRLAKNIGLSITQISQDKAGVFWLSSYFKNTYTLDDKTFTSRGERDILLLAMRPDGKVLKSIQWGGDDFEWIRRFIITDTGVFYGVGESSSTSLSFSANTTLTNNAPNTDPAQRTYDAILIKLRDAAPVDITMEPLPEGFYLAPNYPNPFNPSTQIAFTLPQASHILLNVYNSLGEEVSRLTSESLQAGTHHYTFEAQHLPSGVYWYQLKVNGRLTQTRPMILVK